MSESYLRLRDFLAQLVEPGGQTLHARVESIHRVHVSAVDATIKRADVSGGVLISADDDTEVVRAAETFVDFGIHDVFGSSSFEVSHLLDCAEPRSIVFPHAGLYVVRFLAVPPGSVDDETVL